MTAKWIHGGCLMLVLSVASPHAAAQGSSERAALEYHAGPGCPDEMAFRDRLAARVSVTFDGRSDGKLSVSLGAANGAGAAGPSGSSRGTLVWNKRGEPIVREVNGATCDEVASALALVAAVLLEQDATEEVPSTPPLPPATPAEPAGAEPPPALPAPPAPLAETTPRSAPGAAKEQEARDARVSLRFAAGAHGLVTSGLGPSLAGGGRLFAEASMEVATRPAIRLSAAWFPGTDLPTEPGTVHFSLASGRLEACPLRLGAELAVTPCGFLEVGRLAAEVGGSTEARLHLAPGALVRFSFRVSGLLALEVEGGAGFPLDHYRFFFTPSPTVYEVPIVTGYGSVGIAVRFP